MVRLLGLGRRARSQAGGEFGQERTKRNSPAFLQLGVMIAVDDRQCVDPASDRRIGGLGFRLVGAAAVNAEQRGDHLEVVLDPVMDFADQPPLPFERIERLSLRTFDPVDRPAEGIAQLVNFRCRAQPRRNDEAGIVARLEVRRRRAATGEAG